MCGIIGCVGRGDDTLDTLLDGLDTLEYRGYDSAGVALANGSVQTAKKAGELDALREHLADRSPSGTVGIGHTRWSTHGPPTDANAHPHCDCTGEVAVVHNGIIENYQTLRDELATDHEFVSDTDTEVIPHLIEDALADHSPEAAVRATLDRLEGSFAIAVVIAGTDAIFAARQDSPLVLGIDDDATYLASDVPAFRVHTDRVVYLDDGQFVRLDADGYTVTDFDGTPRSPSVETVDWDPEATGKAGYDHFMLKEIHEQPRALRQCLQGRVDELAGDVTLDIDPDIDRVQFVACGTSYHAALYGAALFRAAGVPAQAFLAHEYAIQTPPVEDDLVVAVSQSGETADTLAAIREADRRGADTLALTNVVGSTMARECTDALFIRSGPEIGVAASKTFSAQLTAVNLLALATVGAGDEDVRDLIGALRDLPADIQTILDASGAREVAREYVDSESFFFIGRGYHHPVALEGALKLKEISYTHAEGFAAGELKHGTLALVTPDTPVFAVVTGDGEAARKTIGNVKEVEARGAPVIAVTDGESDVERYADAVLEIPSTHARTAAVLANVQLQLVAYHVANELGRSIDKPRNLAKSVTVE
ncbi:glutamine--fructose-6-phosphate transaminase (isomerizing) [Halosegnis rubeus]|uniref:Glutamine--fructose-6-phosphate aminotransferase [isomerizing] n=1 Tax=Halosegnis rubeus TaxID=2212850 RepID=A0A5N5U7Z6_9EURY|nr:glutamine--fructose-6-phosphate transaminase (isomerizing) [Halosegnis rubeus]KAB7514637.1 glutamine--fructose-6-phosphate transaminase (isomerizing) [Halosegnis rubeus]